MQCIDESCTLRVADTGYVNFVTDCDDDGYLAAMEVPFRFSGRFDLVDVDGLDVDLRVWVEDEAGSRTTSERRVTLRASEFVAPITFDP